jgi:hypothetical protein
MNVTRRALATKRPARSSCASPVLPAPILVVEPSPRRRSVTVPPQADEDVAVEVLEPDGLGNREPVEPVAVLSVIDLDCARRPHCEPISRQRRCLRLDVDVAEDAACSRDQPQSSLRPHRDTPGVDGKDAQLAVRFRDH